MVIKITSETLENVVAKGLNRVRDVEKKNTEDLYSSIEDEFDSIGKDINNYMEEGAINSVKNNLYSLVDDLVGVNVEETDSIEKALDESQYTTEITESIVNTFEETYDFMKKTIDEETDSNIEDLNEYLNSIKDYKEKAVSSLEEQKIEGMSREELEDQIRGTSEAYNEVVNTVGEMAGAWNDLDNNKPDYDKVKQEIEQKGDNFIENNDNYQKANQLLGNSESQA